MRVKEESEKAGLNSTLRKQKSWHLVASLDGIQIWKKFKEIIPVDTKEIQP